MARQLSLAVQEHLNTGEAIDPLMIVGISFAPGQETLYADRDLGEVLNPHIKGKILEFGELETITRLDGNGSSSSISFRVDDANGDIKWILNNTDIIYNKVVVYQHFANTSFQNMIPLFEGVLATPIEWEEGSRSVQLTAITRQSNYEVGFALDESTVPVFHQSLLDKVWPMVFGSPLYTPVLDLQEIPTGILVNPIYITDPSFPFRVQELSDQMDAVRAEVFDKGVDYALYNRWLDLYKTSYIPAGESSQFGKTKLSMFTTDALEGLHLREAFKPAYYQMMAIIDEDLNNYLNWSRDKQFRLATLKEERTFTIQQWELQNSRQSRSNAIIGGYRFPPGRYLCKINEETFYISFPYAPPGVHPDASASVTIDPVMPPYVYTPGQGIAGSRFIQAGAQVEILDNFPGGYHHVASITPGVVEGVYAWQSINGFRRLARVPGQYWGTRTEVKGGYTITYIVTTRPLATVAYFENITTQAAEDAIARIKNLPPGTETVKIQNKIEWENEIFVNFQSTIGPNTVDIIIWLIQHYTIYTFDHATFSAVWTHVNPYPANFALLDRPNVDELIKDIAYQSRCAVWIKNGVYYIKYLPASPNITNTISGTDIIFGTLKVSASSTDQLVTKYIASWKPDGLQEATTIIVKNNVERFGILEEEHDFFIYDNYNTVLKSATFWLIRKSNIWKIVNAECFLTKLGIETLDDVLLSLVENTSNGGAFVTNDPAGVACQVESAQYNSENNSIVLELWTGIKFGSMDVYPFARPADSSVSLAFPTYGDHYRGDLPQIPFDNAAPNIPKFNASQPNPPIKTEVKQRHYTVTYIMGPAEPSTKGDTYPSDQKTTVDYGSRPLSPKIVPARATPPADNYEYKKPPVPIEIKPPTGASPINTDTGLGDGGGGEGSGTGIPGYVFSRGDDGTLWNVYAYLDGPGIAPTLLLATELHGDSELIGIETEWVTIFTSTVDTVTRYWFYTQHLAIMPVKMASNSAGEIYPRGKEIVEAAWNTTVTQIQIGEGYNIPVDTWAMACRIWNGTSFIYETQVPVWRFAAPD